MQTVNDILKEFLQSIDKTFKKIEPNFYGFIQRDVTRFPDIESKLEAINKIEHYRLNDGKGLPLIEINPSMLVGTQEDVDTDKMDDIMISDSVPPVFVVKLNAVWYLLDGHHRVMSAIKKGERKIKAHLLNFDK